MANMMQSLQMPQRPPTSFWSGRPEFTEQTPVLTQGQQGVQNSGIEQLLAMLGQGNQNQYQGFQPIEDRARNQFATQTIPGLAERFTSFGTQRSGAYKNALNSAGREFELGLGALKSQYGQNQQSLNNQRFGQLSQLAFQPSFQNNHFARQPGAPESFFNALGGGLGAILPFLPMLFGLPPIPGLGQGNKQQPSQAQPTTIGNSTGSAASNPMAYFGQQPLNFGRVQ